MISLSSFIATTSQHNFQVPDARDVAMDCISERIMEDQDTWQDARMDEVISYLRYSKKMNLDATDVIDLVKNFEERLKQAKPSE